MWKTLLYPSANRKAGSGGGRGSSLLRHDVEQDSTVGAEEGFGRPMAREKYVKAGDYKEEATHDHGVPRRIRLEPALERH